MTVNPETVEQVASTVEKKESPSAFESSKPTEGLSQVELASRLKNLSTGEDVASSTIGRARKRMGEQEFLVWSKERDPDSIGWTYSEKTERYFPQDAP